MVAFLLLGTPLETSISLVVGRVGGVALLAIGVACWLARDGGSSRATNGLAKALLLYNVGVLAVLAHAGLGPKLIRVGYWPAMLLHGLMTVACIVSLRTTPGARFDHEV